MLKLPIHSGYSRSRVTWLFGAALAAFFLPLTTGALPGSTIASPPAFSIFSMAVSLKRWAEIFSFFVNFAVAEDLQLVEAALGQILGASSASGVTSSPALKSLSSSPTLTAATRIAQRLLKPRLGMRRTSGHRTAFEDRDARPAGPRALALVTAAGRLALARADAATEPLARLVLLDAAMNVVEVHDSVTPRSRSTSCFGRSLLERGERGLDQRHWVVRAEALGEDVVDAGRFANGANGRAGDDARTGRAGSSTTWAAP